MQVEPRDSFSFDLSRELRHDREVDWFDELRRPVKAPDVAPAVMSRLGRAMPGISGRNGGRQAWVWRTGIAAALALASGIGIWYGHINEQRTMPASYDTVPHIADVMRSIESDVQPSRNAFAAMFEAVNHVASHVEPAQGQMPVQKTPIETSLVTEPKSRRLLFPIDEKYWSMRRHPELGPTSPVQSKEETGSGTGNDEDTSDQDEWQETHSDDSPKEPSFRFSAGVSGTPQN